MSREPILIEPVIQSAISLMQEQLRLRQIDVLQFPAQDLVVAGNAIQLEQVFINLLTNARDAMADVRQKTITITCTQQKNILAISFVIPAQVFLWGLSSVSLIHFLRPKMSGLALDWASLSPTVLLRIIRGRLRLKITLGRERSSLFSSPWNKREMEGFKDE